MNYNEKYELIDLSQEIYQGMPVFGMHQKTFIMTNQTHEENMKQTGSKTLGFSARNLLISEHGPTHSDAVWEYNPEGPTIDKMDMKLFYGSAILDARRTSVTRIILKQKIWRKRLKKQD